MSRVLSVHQPNFIPWAGYFHKILNSDVFVVLDDVQFVKRSVCNRNKIKAGDGNELMLTVPVKLSRGSRKTYRELEIAYDQKWTGKILKSIQLSYQQSDYFQPFFDDLTAIFLKHSDNLAAFNISIIKYITRKLKIETPFYYQSEIDANPGEKNERIINLCKYFDADVYLSGAGAMKYNDPEMFKQNDIGLEYQQFDHPVYPQQHGAFVSHLSIIDMLFNCGAEQSRKYLEES